MKVYIFTFGCRVNQYESEAISELLLKSGFEITSNLCNADIVIFNSCTVTAESDRKLRQLIRKIKKYNNAYITVVMGCMPQALQGSIKKLDGVDIILGNSNKNRLSLYISEFIKNRKPLIKVEEYEEHKFVNLPISNFSDRTRAFLKVEDGCNNFCSYCIIPYARGRVRSKPIIEIYHEAERLVKNGYKDITLVGINLLSYGTDSGESLLQAINKLSEIDDLKRIRLGSIEPDLVKKDFLVELSKNNKFCPHFHLSAQSGSNKILKLMRRRYTREEYIEIVEIIKKLFTDATITTDLMVGFPNESEDDFNQSLGMIKDIQFLKVHTFPYSKRPGTLASEMPNQVLKRVKTERVKKIISEASMQSRAILNKYIGKETEVLYENTKDKETYEGYTKNYILVRTKSKLDLRGKIIPTIIDRADSECCVGRVVNNL